MLENFTNLMKNINLHIQEVQQIASRIKLKETHTLRCHNQTSKCQRQRENLVISKTEATHQVQAISDKIFYLTFHKQPWRQKAMGWPKALKERLSTKNSTPSKTNTKKKKKKKEKLRLTQSKNKENLSPGSLIYEEF